MDKPNYYWHQYFNWMAEVVGAHRVELLAILDSIPFEWSVKNDDNRAADGIELRRRFAETNYIELTDEDFAVPCSVLEMMVALALRCDNDIMGEPGEEHPEIWFWMMIRNLGLDEGVSDEQHVREVIDIWLKRKFEPDGKGSPFPGQKFKTDQRKVEIWSQLNNYLIENYG